MAPSARHIHADALYAPLGGGGLGKVYCGGTFGQWPEGERESPFAIIAHAIFLAEGDPFGPCHSEVGAVGKGDMAVGLTLIHHLGI